MLRPPPSSYPVCTAKGTVFNLISEFPDVLSIYKQMHIFLFLYKWKYTKHTFHPLPFSLKALLWV